LEVRYKDNKLEKLCTNEREMRRRRSDIQKKLRLRVNALRTATTVGDLPRDDPGGAWHELKGHLDGIWSGELSRNWRLLVEPDPLKSLSAVVVTVIDIADYH
jgi:proteic killer suppression protein